MRMLGRLALPLLALVIMTTNALAADTVVTRTVAPFTSIEVDGRFMLLVTVAPTQSVRLSGDRYLIDNLQVGAAHGVLSIDRPHGFDLPKDETVAITITVPSLASVGLRGLVHASVTGLVGPRFQFINNGAAAATLSGTVGQFSLISRGVSSIDAGGLRAKDVTMMVRGQGTMRVFASEMAKVTLYGEGRIDVLGHPPRHEFKTLAYGVITLK